MRRTLIIISVVVVVLGLGVAAYFTLFSQKPTLSVGGNPSLPGSGNTTSTGTSTGTTSQGTSSGSSSQPTTPPAVRLALIDQGPVVPGELVLDTKASLPTSASSTASTTQTVADIQTLYIKRESGNIFSYLTSTGQTTRTSNRTIPGIEEASWLQNGLEAAVRYLSGSDFSTINTYLLPADGSSGSFLPQNISDIATGSSTILVLASGVNGTIASIDNGAGNQVAQVFSSPLSSIRASFAGKNQYLAFTKPAASIPGYAFLVDGKGNFSQIAGPLSGLVALPSPSGAWVLVSYVDSGAMKLELIQTASHNTISLPIGTIADKCVWTLDESAVYCGVPTNPASGVDYPDSWYQGVTHFSDRIWKIDVTGRFAQLVLDFPSETQKVLDATALSIDPGGKQLVFLNKNDGSLWRYEL